MLKIQKPLIERAFELARTGRFTRQRELRDTLKKEGYTVSEITAHFAGRDLRKKIQALCQKQAGTDGSMQR